MMTTAKPLVGVLELNSGKTYGRQIRTTKKEGRLLYGIRHHYTNIPPVKAPYDIRNQQRVGTCSRYVKDKYVIFRTTENIDVNTQHNERPEVQIVETLGDVDDLTAFSNYRALYDGFKLSSCWAKQLQKFRSQDALTDRHATNSSSTRHIFTIDPDGCKDMDDGVGITQVDDTNSKIFDISVAITHVPSFINATGLNTDTLVNSLTNTCSLYLGVRVINMLPKHFAEHLCSLTEKKVTPALVMTVRWNRETLSIINTDISIENVEVVKNYVYDTPELTTNQDYRELFDCVQELSQHHRTFVACPTINDSHDVIAYLMTLMNFYVMEWLERHSLPCIYRVNRSRDDLTCTLPDNLRRKLGNYAGEYCDFSKVTEYRDATKDNPETLTVWTHITSPMRRLADLTNMMSIAIHMYPDEYISIIEFRDYCLSIVTRMSQEYKLSRYVSLDCGLFAFVKSESDDGTLFSREYEGIVFQEANGDDGLSETMGVVYVEELSRFFSCITGSSSLFQKVKCRIVAFDEGHNITDKVRLVIVEN